MSLCVSVGCVCVYVCVCTCGTGPWVCHPKSHLKDDAGLLQQILRRYGTTDHTPVNDNTQSRQEPTRVPRLS